MQVLATFLDNHDVSRVWNLLLKKRSDKEDTPLVLNALTYLFMSYGIPSVYYGTESQLSGGVDPNNREVFDPYSQLPDPTLRKYIKILNKVRKTQKAYEYDPEFK